MALTQIKLAAMAANSVDSDQYVDASIDNAHIADDAVDGDQLANNLVLGSPLVLMTLVMTLSSLEPQQVNTVYGMNHMIN